MIDTDVVVPPGHIAAVVTRLEGLGYRHRGDLGIPDREAFRPPSSIPRHHLYLCPEGSVPLANHITLRDHLRCFASDAQAYGELKRRLARESPGDIDGYISGKTEFILGVLQANRFDQEALDDIGRRNLGLPS